MKKETEYKGFEFIIEEKDVLKRADFGAYYVVLCKQGALFSTYTGYKVFTTQYAVGSNGKVCDTSLYTWLRELVEFKENITGKENNIFVDNITNADMLEGMVMTTVANIMKPMAVFTDYNEAQKEAMRYLDWLETSAKDLQTAESTTPPEEDYKENAKHNAEILATETLKEIANDRKNSDYIK